MADEGDALVAGNFCQTPSYMSGLGKEVVQEEFKKQVDVFVKNNVDFLIGEVIFSVEIFPRLEFQSNYLTSIYCDFHVIIIFVAVYVCGRGRMGD